MLSCNVFVVFRLTVLLILTIHPCSSCSLSNWTSTSVRVSWPSNWYPRQTDHYRIICTSTPRCGTTIRGRRVFNTTVTSLIPGTYYKFQVANNQRRAGRYFYRFCAGTTTPGFEENDTCTVQSTDADSATVSWPAPSSAQFYYIDIGSDKLFNSTSNTSTVTALKPITNYTFTVTVYGNAAIAGNSVECRGKTGPRIPGPCSTNFASTTQFTVSWPETYGATQFNVQVYDNVTQERIYNTTVRMSNSANVTVTNVEPDSQYTFYITGLGNDNQRGNTVSCTGRTPTPADTGSASFPLSLIIAVAVLPVVILLFAICVVVACKCRRRRSSEEHGKQTAEQQPPQVATVAAPNVYEEIDMEVKGYSIPNFKKSSRSPRDDYDQLKADTSGLSTAGVYQSTPVYYKE